MIAPALLALSAVAAPAPPAAAPLAPTGKWVLDFADTQCLASRTYGSAAKPLTLAFRPSPNGDIYELVVLQDVAGSRFAREVPATVTIDGRPPIATKMLVYKPGKSNARLARASLPAVVAHDLRNARTLTVNGESGLRFTFALSGTGPLMTEMDRCLNSLQDHWNMSPFRTAALRQPAEGSLQKVFRPEDYPEVAMDGSAEGSVTVQLLVDQTGKVADCMLTQTSGHATLDAQSCAMIRTRARYKPALDAEGKPTRAGTMGRIVWRIAD